MDVRDGITVRLLDEHVCDNETVGISILGASSKPRC